MEAAGFVPVHALSWLYSEPEIGLTIPAFPLSNKLDVAMLHRLAPALLLALACTAAPPAVQAQTQPPSPNPGPSLSDTVICSISALNKCVGKTCEPLTFANRTIRISMTERTACVRVGSNPACNPLWKFEIVRRTKTSALVVFPTEAQLFFIHANGLFSGADLSPTAEFTFRGTCKPDGGK